MSNLRNKGFQILLASSLMFTSGVIPAFANDATMNSTLPAATAVKDMQQAKISKEKAVQLASQAIPIPSDFTQTNVEFQSNWWGNGTAVWMVSWNRQTPPHYGNINVVIDADSGAVVNIDMYTNTTTKPSYPPKVDLPKAKEVALDYIKKYFPKQASSLVYDDRYEQNKPPLNGYIEYPITFKREVNGIPYEGNEIRVSVNGEGEVVNMNYRWDQDIEFPAVGKVIGLEQVESIYTKYMNLSLKLLPQWGPAPADRKMNLGYMPQMNNYYEPNFIRATDGVLLTPWGQEIAKDETGFFPISDKKLGDLPSGKNLTQEQALAALKTHFDVPDDKDMIRATYREQWGETQTSVWEFNWETKDQGIAAGWSMSAVDAKTGRILTYNNENRIFMEKAIAAEQGGAEATEKPKITKEQAQQKAIELMKKLNPDMAHQIYLQKIPMHPGDASQTRFYNFSFVRQVHGVSPEYGGINMNIDALTGEVTNYWFDAMSINLPDSVPQVVSKEAALKTYMDRIDLRLTYVTPQQYQPVKAGETFKPTKAILVYQPRFKEFGEPIFLDAKTGQWTNRETGKPLVDIQAVSDIKGHAAEKELSLLVKYNVFEIKDGKILPNEEINRGEMIKMLVLIENNGYTIWHDPNRAATFKDVSNGSPYFAYVEQAVDRNWLDRGQEQINPEQKVNREELAEFIIKALGYENLVEIPDLFQNHLADKDEIESVGAAILATKLGIMDTQDDKFVPQGKVSRADAAVAFYRYLSKRSVLRNY